MVSFHLFLVVAFHALLVLNSLSMVLHVLIARTVHRHPAVYLAWDARHALPDTNRTLLLDCVMLARVEAHIH